MVYRLISVLLVLSLFLASCSSTPAKDGDADKLQRAAASQVRVSFPLALSREAAWQILQDYSLAQNYVPGITRTEIVSVEKNGVGAHRHVFDDDNDYTEETIIEWNEGYGFVMRLHLGDEPIAPFTFSQFRYQLSDDEEGRSRVDLTIYYKMPWGGLGGFLNAVLIESIVEGTLRKVGAGMKYFYETGQPATDENRKQYKHYVQVVEDE